MMKPFHYKHHELFCDGVAVSEIAEAVGTPFYLYSRKQLENNYEDILKAVHQSDHLICYALKANANPSLLQILGKKGCGAEVVSGGELQLAIKSGITPEQIVFSGVGKTEEEIEQAIGNSILAINVESVEELKIINQIAGKMNTKAGIAIRINPDIDVKTHHYIATGLRESKFGIDPIHTEEAFKLSASLPNVELNGIHCHIGSMIMESEPFNKAFQVLIDWTRRLKASGISLSHIDIGGGVGVDYMHIVDTDTKKKIQKQEVINLKRLFSSIIPVVQKAGLKFIFEPGRLLMADIAVLITRVLYKKSNGARNFTIVDAGMSDMIRPALYNAYHQIVAVKYSDTIKEKSSIVGPICETGDFFAHDQLLPGTKRNDLLAITGTGAYGFVLSSNYNGRPRPSEILVNGKDYKIIRKREKNDSLWKGTELGTF